MNVIASQKKNICTAFPRAIEKKILIVCTLSNRYSLDPKTQADAMQRQQLLLRRRRWRLQWVKFEWSLVAHFLCCPLLSVQSSLGSGGSGSRVTPG